MDGCEHGIFNALVNKNIILILLLLPPVDPARLDTLVGAEAKSIFS